MELCDHCYRPLGGQQGTVGDMTVCRPVVAGRPNCYLLVTRYDHKKDCGICRLAGMVVAR